MVSFKSSKGLECLIDLFMLIELVPFSASKLDLGAFMMVDVNEVWKLAFIFLLLDFKELWELEIFGDPFSFLLLDFNDVWKLEIFGDSFS